MQVNKGLFKYAAVLLLGFIIGAVFMEYLAMRAASTYLFMITAEYRGQEEVLGNKAWSSDKLNDAAIHYYNIAHMKDMKAIDPEFMKWPFTFPFYSLAFNALMKSDIPAKNPWAKTYDEGFARGRLGMVLEELGRNEEAQQELLLANKLTGTNDMDKLRKILKGFKATLSYILKP